MPEQNQPINTLPIKTASGMAATDYLLGIGSTEEYQMLIQDLGDYIIQHATSSLAGESQTLASAILGLHSMITTETIPANSDLNNYIAPGIYAQNTTKIVPTIDNTPADVAFVLEVLFLQSAREGNWLGGIQRFTELSGKAFYLRRMYTNGSGQWNFEGWYKYSGTAMT